MNRINRINKIFDSNKHHRSPVPIAAYEAQFITDPITLPWQTVAFPEYCNPPPLLDYPVDILVNAIK